MDYRFLIGARSWNKIALGMGLGGIAALAFCLGRTSSVPPATAAPPTSSAPKSDKPTTSSITQTQERSSDYSRRVVAYIHGTVAITREDLGEYLIARQGADKLEFLCNKRIIEHACKEKGITVTAAEVDASLSDDLKELKLTLKEFENRLLKEYRKTLYEWKEDVIWPKIALTRLCRERVKVEPKDLSNAFEAYHGAKVEGRIIMFRPEEKNIAEKVWPRVRDSEDEFTRQAKQQASPTLAAAGGKLPQPIGRHSTGSDKVENEIFALKPGEVSTIMETPEGYIIFKCDKHIPADKSVALDSVRAKLEKEIIDKKIQAEMPTYFKELRAKANPKMFLKRYINEEDWLRDIRQEIEGESSAPAPGKTPPAGN